MRQVCNARHTKATRSSVAIKCYYWRFVSCVHLHARDACLYVHMFWCVGRCPPCRAFTPRLVQTYKELKKRAGGNDLEFIFVSSDKDQSQFDE